MKRSTIVRAVLGFSLGIALILSFIFVGIKGQNAYELLRSFEPISKIDITYINAPNLPRKEMITISDRAILDSLNKSFNNLKSLRVDVSKTNDFYAELIVYKAGQKASMDVFNSKFTGWILRVGYSKFKDEYLFELMQKHIPK
ncbi:hypothetical protein A4D02_20490 [Niastella koreensis]|uniref:Uncharacterized protein n=2 Tax=Niastella koreensis TaxID=354356 RepID=G8TKB1_NIAKG|nr:hypothetical protein [Niastella koreensis]AEV96545.1 hypothetical protein Niako_0145 [Niastella koreensis GR20-10]OQP54061.1 hypothetical protein A4D02_20490 [Niastella koreensis]